jgi:hypothetical protein
MSETFGVVDIQNLQFPAYMFIDYIRVYQRPSNISVGCSPPGYPTEQWIACHKENYMTNPSDSVLFAPCKSSSKPVFTFPNLAIVLVSLLLVALLL